MYQEDKRAYVDVDDEDDFELGMTQVLHTKVPREITFIVQFEQKSNAEKS